MSKPLFAPDGKPDFAFENCNTVKELADYLTRLVNYEHDYNTSGYAITKALLAVEMYMAHALGTTGAQHGFAQLSYVTETRFSKTGCAIIDFDNLLYPQYDILEKVAGWIKDHKKSEHFRKVVQKNLDENEERQTASPNVINHWKALLNG